MIFRHPIFLSSLTKLSIVKGKAVEKSIDVVKNIPGIWMFIASQKSKDQKVIVSIFEQPSTLKLAKQLQANQYEETIRTIIKVYKIDFDLFNESGKDVKRSEYNRFEIYLKTESTRLTKNGSLTSYAKSCSCALKRLDMIQTLSQILREYKAISEVN